MFQDLTTALTKQMLDLEAEVAYQKVFIKGLRNERILTRALEDLEILEKRLFIASKDLHLIQAIGQMLAVDGLAMPWSGATFERLPRGACETPEKLDGNSLHLTASAERSFPAGQMPTTV